MIAATILGCLAGALVAFTGGVICGVIATRASNDPPPARLDRATRRRLARNAPHLRIVRANERRSS